jgi:hypothetical protein
MLGTAGVGTTGCGERVADGLLLVAVAVVVPVGTSTGCCGAAAFGAVALAAAGFGVPGNSGEGIAGDGAAGAGFGAADVAACREFGVVGAPGTGATGAGAVILGAAVAGCAVAPAVGAGTLGNGTCGEGARAAAGSGTVGCGAGAAESCSAVSMLFWLFAGFSAAAAEVPGAACSAKFCSSSLNAKSVITFYFTFSREKRITVKFHDSSSLHCNRVLLLVPCKNNICAA